MTLHFRYGITKWNNQKKNNYQNEKSIA